MLSLGLDIYIHCCISGILCPNFVQIHIKWVKCIDCWHKHISDSITWVSVSDCIPYIVTTVCKSTKDCRQNLKEWKQTNCFWRVLHHQTTLLCGQRLSIITDVSLCLLNNEMRRMLQCPNPKVLSAKHCVLEGMQMHDQYFKKASVY